jgi:hypothetical protein
VQRSHLTSVLASLGLGGGLGACERAPTVEPEPTQANPRGEEPSGFGEAPKLEIGPSSKPDEPRFVGVPLAFCDATFEQHDHPLLETQSFLQAWNELAPPIRNPLAHNIPATEIDARVLLCGAQQCTLETAKLAEAIADYMVGVGVLIPSDGGMLVIPDLSSHHLSGSCTNETELGVVQRSELIHVRAITHERRYTYGHYGYGHHYNPFECQTYSIARRDLIIDATRGELELVIHQQRSAEDGRPWLELELGNGQIVLRGCDSSMPLQWTQ